MIKCPYCGKSHFTQTEALSDLVYRPIVYKDGKVTSSSVSYSGSISYTYHCLACGKDFESKESIFDQQKNEPIQCDNINEEQSISLNGDTMNKTVKDKEYIDFGVTPYALPDVLLALDNEGITRYWVTKEDNDLHIRIEKDYLREKVYKVKIRPLEDEEKDIPVTPYPSIMKDYLGGHVSQPNCETCPYKGGLKDAFGNPVIGDSPCDFCPSNPRRIICSSEGK